MDRRVITAVAFALSSCEPVHLQIGEPTPAREAPAPEVLPTSNDAPTTCAARCLGGRQCVEGACLPHWLPIASPEVSGAEPRVGHYAVWTGTEVIVWGGHNPRLDGAAGLHGDGFRFDPGRGEVRALSRRSAPSPRFAGNGGTAVWTGREMVIWGGRTDAGELTDGAAYVPASDQWVTFANVMAPRAQVTAVFTGMGVILAGAGGVNDAWRWDPSLASWVPATTARSMSAPRRGHATAWTGTELIAWGGVDADGNTLADGWRFSPLRKRGRPMGLTGAPAPRSQHTAVWADSEMLVFGGRGADAAPLASLAAYVPAVDAWREVSSEGAPSPRYGHVSVWTGRSLLVWGGTDGRHALDDGGEFDPWDNAWHPMEAVAAGRDAAGREGSAGVWTGSELIVVGGTDGSASISPLGWRYQP